MIHVNKEIIQEAGGFLSVKRGIKFSTDVVKVSAQQKLVSNPKVNNIKKNMADKELAAPPNVGIALAITINAMWSFLIEGTTTRFQYILRWRGRV